MDEITEKRFIYELEHNNIHWNKSGNNIMIMCPFHNDTSSSLGVNFHKDVFNCLSCHEKGKIWYLFKYLFELEDLEEDEFYEEAEETEDLLHIRQRINDLQQRKEKTEMIKILVNFDIDKYKRPTMDYSKYLKGRNITKQSCNEFNIRSGMWKGDKRIIIPMKDEYGRLVSVLGRSIKTNAGKDKVRKSKNSDVGKILFNLDKAKIFKYCVLTEGEIDAIYLWQYSIPSVSAGTTSLTDWQIYKLSIYFDAVYLALDGSVKRKVWLPAMKKLRECIDKVERLQLPIDKDPNELNEKEVHEIFGNLMYRR